MKKSNIKSMTAGSPFRLLLLFALPLMAGNAFQQLYTVTDTAIVGQALGVTALAALGTVEWFNWMALGVVEGLTQGFSIQVAQKFGAAEEKELCKAVGNSVILAGIFALVMTLAMEAAVNPALIIFKVPLTIAPIARTYLRVMFAGIPVMMAYNMQSAILRALGDSRTPLLAMVFASILNISLDLLFVLVFHWGVAGAASATIAAQIAASTICFVKLRTIPLLKLPAEAYYLDKVLVKRLLILGCPLALQNGIVSVGGMILQAVVNQHGVAFIAGFSATNKLYGVLEVAALSYGYALTTYTGQNLGAGNLKRISQGIRAGLIIAMITSAIITSCMFLFGRAILGLFIAMGTPEGAEAMKTGLQYLHIMSLFLPILYILHVVRNCVQGMGNTLAPMSSGFVELFMRTTMAFLMPALIGAQGVMFAEVSAWMGADLVLIPSYFYTMGKMRKTQ